MKFQIAILAFAITGCATTTLSVQSNPPGADVYLRSVGSADYRLVGKTPLFVSNLQLDKNQASHGAVQLELRMDGFKPDDFVITEVSQIDLQIIRELEPKRDLEMQGWLNNHLNKMLEVRELVATFRYKEALQIIQRLKEQTPMVAVLHKMEGGVQLLLKDWAAALRAYRMAAKLDPENTESVRMVRHLESTYGYRREVDIFDTNMLRDEKARQPSSSPGEK